jgi:hypothetical protein
MSKLCCSSAVTTAELLCHRAQEAVVLKMMIMMKIFCLAKKIAYKFSKNIGNNNK